MSRRSTPERIDAARRAATRNRLIGDGVTEPTADGWVAAWEAQAERDGIERSAAYWEAGWDWIEGSVRAGPGPRAGTTRDAHRGLWEASRPALGLGWGAVPSRSSTSAASPFPTPGPLTILGPTGSSDVKT